MQMPMTPVPGKTTRQLTLIFDTAILEGMEPGEHAAAVTQLAILLMEAASAATEERDHDER